MRPIEAASLLVNHNAPSGPAVSPYVPGCHGQNVTVPGADGKDQTVNIVRCY